MEHPFLKLMIWGPPVILGNPHINRSILLTVSHFVPDAIFVQMPSPNNRGPQYFFHPATVGCLGASHCRNSMEFSTWNYPNECKYAINHSASGHMTSSSLSKLLGITGGTMKTPSARSWSHAWTARHNDSMPLEEKISHGPYMGLGIFTYIFCVFMSMVNVEIFTIHGWYMYFNMSSFGSWISGP